MPGLIDKLEQTTLILGAGASHPYGFPLGGTLRDRLLTMDKRRDDMLVDLGVTDLRPFRQQLHRFQAASIDDFLAKYPEHARVAKLQIAYELMVQEGFDRHVDQGRADHWYKYLYDEVLGNDPQLGSGKLSIITFNYDLSLEAYLHTTIVARHRVSESEATDLVSRLPLVHVHGYLGPANFAHGSGRSYGLAKEPAILDETAKQILTIHDAPSDALWQAAYAMLSKAGRVMFLGFGFGEENLARLAAKGGCKPKARAFLAVKDCDFARARFTKYFPNVSGVTYKDSDGPTTAPALARARWLFEKATALTPDIQFLNGPGRRRGRNWVQN